MIGKIIIRKAKMKDCEEVHKLCEVKGLVNPSGEPPKLWWIKSFITEKQIFFIAENDKKIVGFIFGERTTGNIGYLWMMAVEKKYQGKGIGKSLLLEAEKECKKRKLRVLVCYGFTENKVVLNMLKKLQYEKGEKYYEFIKFLK